MRSMDKSPYLVSLNDHSMVGPFRTHEYVMTAALHNTPILDNEDLVGAFYGVKPVRDDQQGFIAD